MRPSAANGQFNPRAATRKAESFRQHIDAQADRAAVNISVEKQITRLPTAFKIDNLAVHLHAIWRAYGFENAVIELYNQFAWSLKCMALQNLVCLRGTRVILACIKQAIAASSRHVHRKFPHLKILRETLIDKCRRQRTGAETLVMHDGRQKIYIVTNAINAEIIKCGGHGVNRVVRSTPCVTSLAIIGS